MDGDLVVLFNEVTVHTRWQGFGDFESLGAGAAGSDGVDGGVICFEMDLCAATSEAFKASRKSPSIGPILCVLNLIST